MAAKARRCRPASGNGPQSIPVCYTGCMTVQIALRLPEEQLSRIDQIVNTTSSSRSEVIRLAVNDYLYRLACETDAAKYQLNPMTDSELGLADTPNSWDSTPSW